MSNVNILTIAEVKAAAPKEYKTVIGAAQRQGWAFSRDGSGHIAARNPDTGAVVTISATASDSGKAFKNTRANFLRAGLLLQGRRPKEWSDADTLKAQANTPISAAKVTSRIDGPLVTMSMPTTAPLPPVMPSPVPKPAPPRQNEKVETPPRHWPLLMVIRSKMLDIEKHERAAKMLEEAAALLPKDALGSHIMDEAVEVLERVKLTPTEKEYYEFAKWNARHDR